jgi:tetratricopeptide (TPR) repeat protein
MGAAGRRSRILLWLVPVALCGCQAMMHSAEPPTGAPAAAGAVPAPSLDATLARSPRSKNKTTTDPATDRSGLPNKLTRDQEYNAHLDLGRFQESQANYELALEEYVKALEVYETKSTLLNGMRNPAKQALAHRRMGAALDRLGRFEQAENEYRTALKLNPNDPKVWNDAGYSYYMQGRLDDAERALKTAAKLDPNNTLIMTNLGLALAASGKTDAALAEFTRAGGPAIGHANLAYMLAAMGNSAEAQKHYRIALQHQPELGPAKMALAALDAKTSTSTQIATASTPAVASSASSLLINKPGVLPVTALSAAVPTAIAQSVPPSPPTAPAFVAATSPAPGSRRVPATVQVGQVARVLSPPPRPLTTDTSVRRAAGPVQAPAPSRVPTPSQAPTPSQTPTPPRAPVPSQGSAPLQVPTRAPVASTRRVPPSWTPLPVPAPMTIPGPVPPYVPPVSN